MNLSIGQFQNLPGKAEENVDPCFGGQKLLVVCLVEITF